MTPTLLAAHSVPTDDARMLAETAAGVRQLELVEAA